MTCYKGKRDACCNGCCSKGSYAFIVSMVDTARSSAKQASFLLDGEPDWYNEMGEPPALPAHPMRWAPYRRSGEAKFDSAGQYLGIEPRGDGWYYYRIHGFRETQEAFHSARKEYRPRAST